MPSKASLANLKPPWTPEQAREAARRSNAAQALKRAAAPDSEAEAPTPEAVEDSPDKFHVRTLGRVRAQINTLLDQLSIELRKKQPDAQRVDRLSAAFGRVEEIERRLSSRSLPPTLRANDKRGSNRRPGAAPTPQPVAPCVPKPAIPASPTPQPIDTPKPQ